MILIDIQNKSSQSHRLEYANSFREASPIILIDLETRFEFYISISAPAVYRYIYIVIYIQRREASRSSTANRRYLYCATLWWGGGTIAISATFFLDLDSVLIIADKNCELAACYVIRCDRRFFFFVDDGNTTKRDVHSIFTFRLVLVYQN